MASIAGAPKRTSASRKARMKPPKMRRERERQRDRAHHGEAAGARDPRRVFQVGGRRGQRGARQDEDDGKRVEARDVDQPRHREDVEERPVRAGDGPVEDVEEAGVGARQDDVGRGAEERRGDEGGDREGADDRLPGHVGARHEPGQRRPDEDAQDARPTSRRRESSPTGPRYIAWPKASRKLARVKPGPSGTRNGREQQDGERRDDEDGEDRRAQQPDGGSGVAPPPPAVRRRAGIRLRLRTARGTSSSPRRPASASPPGRP